MFGVDLTKTFSNDSEARIYSEKLKATDNVKDIERSEVEMTEDEPVVGNYDDSIPF